jgi:hypothetical protein
VDSVKSSFDLLPLAEELHIHRTKPYPYKGLLLAASWLRPWTLCEAAEAKARPSKKYYRALWRN